MKKKTALLFFALAAVVGLVLHYFMFEMAYGWYTAAADARLMHVIYAACVAVILLLWAFFPSRIAVGIIGLSALLFPHLVFAPDARPLLGRELDVPSLAVAVAGVILLVLATHFRRNARSA